MILRSTYRNDPSLSTVNFLAFPGRQAEILKLKTCTFYSESQKTYALIAKHYKLHHFPSGATNEIEHWLSKTCVCYSQCLVEVGTLWCSGRHKSVPNMPNCPKCEKPVYFAERKTSLGKDWHSACLRCEKCNKTLTPGSHAEHEGKPYCNQPCYAALFGPTGFGRGGAESYVYNK